MKKELQQQVRAWIGVAAVLLGVGVSLSTYAETQVERQVESMALPVHTAFFTGSELTYFDGLEEAGIVVLNERAQVLHARSAQRHFIPASTTKVLTALLALRHWGADYRFKTIFLLKGQSVLEQANPSRSAPRLHVKGYGDPYLVSEELIAIAKTLATRLKAGGVVVLSGIELDTGYYAPNLKMPGASESDNPYDAIPSALAANFNTLYIRKTATGFESAEPQTPLTPTALQIAKKITQFEKTPSGLTKRVNLGGDERVGQRYFAELLAAFLRKEGIAVGDDIHWQSHSQSVEEMVENAGLQAVKNTRNSSLKMLYLHENSRTLDEVIRPMLLYSTNFIAHQLALSLSADKMGEPADQQSVAQVTQQSLASLFDWSDFTVEEGAGLSRENRLSPLQLIDVLDAFKPWRTLLPEVVPNVFAKSGTLSGVSTLAGYIHTDRGWYPFAFMINQNVPYGYRNQLAKALSQNSFSVPVAADTE